QKKGTVPELQAELRRLQIPSDKVPPSVVLEESSSPEGLRQQIRFESEPGVEIKGKLHIPSSSERKPAVLLVSDESSGSLAEKIVKSGRIVLELEPRDSPAESDRRPFVGNWIANARAIQIGLNLPAMRAHDLLRGIDLLAARSDVDPS